MKTASQAPAKILLFGEWAVLNGGPAVLTTLNRIFRCEIANRNDQRISFHSHDPILSQVVDSPLEADGFFKWAGQCLDKLTALVGKEATGLSFHFTSDWKVKEGIGSSSALFLSLFKALRLHFSLSELNGNELFETSKNTFFEISNGSGADLAAQCAERPIVFSNGSMKPLSLSFPPHLRIVHTGKKWKTNKEISKRTLPLHLQERIIISTSNFLEKKNWQEAIHEHYLALDEFGVVPEEVRTFFKENPKSIRALKTTGAGGGDALICLINSEEEEHFSKEIAQRGWWSPSYTLNTGANS